MNKLRKDAILGIVLLVLYLVIKYLFRGGGILLWLLGIAGLALLIAGLLPEELHTKAMNLKKNLFEKRK